MRISLAALGIAVVGVLIYFLSSGIQPDKSSVVPDRPVGAVSGNPPATTGPALREERSSPRESTHTHDNTAARPADLPGQQQVPALEPEIRAALGDILNTSSEGLVEETRNGVTSVDLQGRFQTAPVATIDENGNIQITDYSHLPAATASP
ncbi:MAG TPA: hypothetical protein ENJ80_14115 [Gammaproteobacteria bacterium]|nr:hypothetical protein [Gammaproteobacteria bacterium]